MNFIAVALLLFTLPAAAAETLDEVVGDPVIAEGISAAELADRGAQCLQASSGNVADKVTPLRDGNTAYAIVLTGYRKMLVDFTVRSRMTIQAKDGRFRISHSDIEQYQEMLHQWGPIYMYAGAGGKQARAALEARSTAAAECMLRKTTPPGGDNW